MDIQEKEMLIDFINEYKESIKKINESHYDYIRAKRMIRYIELIGETQITDEQAWNKIAEAYPETPQSLRITLDHAVFGQGAEPQKVKVPECVGKDLDAFTKARLKEDLVKDICLAVYDYSQGTPFVTATVKWCRKGSNLRTMIDAIWNGYEVEEEPEWVVKRGLFYFEEFDSQMNGDKFGFNGDQRLAEAHHFSDKSKAEAVADLIGGEVKKLRMMLAKAALSKKELDPVTEAIA